MKKLDRIKGILFDLDGTLYFKGKMIDGAKECIEALRGRDIGVRFLTNTDTKSISTLFDQVRTMGLPIYEKELHTPVVAATNYILRHHLNVFPMVSDNIHPFFHYDENRPVDAVVVGDFKDKVTYSLMNKAFRFIDDGAELIALQKGRYFYSSEGKNLDAGSFVKMLEYASGKTARVLGKPDVQFFMSSVHDLGLKPEEVMIIGDDITTDIKGASFIGAVSVLVKTGKYSDASLMKSVDVKPDYIIDSVASLMTIFDE